MFILVPLLAPLVLLAVMGMAWVEDHLVPPAGPPSQALAKPDPARGALTGEPAERPQRPSPLAGRAREPAPRNRTAARGDSAGPRSNA